MAHLFGPDAALTGDAVLSDCGKYRYSLTRRWDDGPTLLFIMLNPSTADSAKDDPTIRRCVAFAKRDGFGAVEVVNLFAFRATDPRHLAPHVDGDLDSVNRMHIETALHRCGKVAVAWGATVRDLDWMGEDVADEVLLILFRAGIRPFCLGRTKAGYPRHPLYVSSGEPLVVFEHRIEE